MRLADDVELSETDYGAVLLDQTRGKYWTLNPTASVVLRCLLDGCDQEQAIDAVLERYTVDRSTAARDLHTLLRQLREAGLINDGATATRQLEGDT